VTKTIEQEALDLINEVRVEFRLPRDVRLYRNTVPVHEALCRVIEQLRAEREAHAATKAEFEAFKREVSDAVEEWHGRWVGAGESHSYFMSLFSRFIIPKPKPDPLAQVAREMVLLDGVVRTDSQKAAIREGRAANTAADDFYDRLRTALPARGLKLVEAGDDRA
jgi:hypothetical protein